MTNVNIDMLNLNKLRLQPTVYQRNYCDNKKKELFDVILQ